MASAYGAVVALLAAAPSPAAVPPRAADPAGAARAHLAAAATLGLSAADVASMAVVRRRELRGTGASVVWLQQTAGGLPVEGATVRFLVDRKGSVAWMRSDALAPGAAVKGERRIGAAQAVARVGAEDAARSAGETRVEAVILADGHPGWRLWLDGEAPADAVAALVDATDGRVVVRRSLAWSVQDGLVFAGAHPDTRPGGVPRTLEPFGATAQSPQGWLLPPGDPLAAYSIGNNADAREDWLDDNETTPGLRADGGASQEFRAAFADSWPASGDYQTDTQAAVTNAFYWVNRWHDMTYALGFDEAAGNCQSDNFGNGGVGGDPVLVDVENRAAPAVGPPLYNHAVVTVPPDGSRPRLQLYLWSPPGGPRADGAFDAEVILHELTHVLVTRLVGGPGSLACLTGAEGRALAEGVADFFALDRFDSTVLGDYAAGDTARGIRDHPVDANPRTYCDLDLRSAVAPQRNGEILATALWGLRTAIGSTRAVQLVVDALALVPCEATFLDLRDALVAADAVRFAGAGRCAIEAAFRDRGMGLFAGAGGGAACDRAFASPDCSGEPLVGLAASSWSDSAGGNGDGLIGAGETIALDVALANTGTTAATGVSATVRARTPGIAMIDATRASPDLPPGSAGAPLAFRFSVGPGYVCGTPVRFEVESSWSSPPRARADGLSLTGGSADGVGLLADDAEGGAVWTPFWPAAVASGENHTPGGTRSYRLSAGCYAGDERACAASGPCDDTCGALTSPAFRLPVGQAAVLSFWTRYNLEESYDGLLAEVSTDGGATWTPLALPGGRPLVPTALGCGIAPGTVGLSGPPGNAGLTAWTEVRADLSAWAGREVVLRVRQHLDGCNYFEGAHVDDIQVAIERCTAAPFAALHALTLRVDDTVDPACTDRDGVPDPLEQARVDATLVNIGNAPAPAATATLSSTNPHVLLLPASVPLGDLAPGRPAPASFVFGVASLAATTCDEDALLGLAYTSALPSSNSEPVDVHLRGTDVVSAWADTFLSSRPQWTAEKGPDGSGQDWQLRSLDCFLGARFWSTHIGMDPRVCASGEPDHSPDSDSLLTSPLIDLGGPNATLLALDWRTLGFATTVEDGFAQVLVDHDGDGVFTPVWTAPGGFGAPPSAGDRFVVDLARPPDGIALPAATTARWVRIRFRFRARAADRGPRPDAEGMSVASVTLSWRQCPLLDCSLVCDPVPVFAGIRSAVDLDPCAYTGVRISWDPAVFGPKGGSYEVYRGTGRIATGLPGPEFLHLPPRDSLFDYRVAAVSADCDATAGYAKRVPAADLSVPTGPVAAVGNTLRAIGRGVDVHLEWAEEPSAETYDLERSSAPDFALPRAVVAMPPLGSPAADDRGAAGLPGLHTYRVAVVRCSVSSQF